ncbi:MAG TPA: hypothetical protein PLE33_08980 [Candidatus Cloacimonas sp.]|nr:hypothetical protein [Candidatus Cloacimonas sp.]
MANIVLTRGGDLPDNAAKADFHNLVDNATATIADIVNADIASNAAIVDTKLATISTAGKVNVTALTATSQSNGDICYFNGTSWVRLGIGTAGQTLTVNAGATAPTWA